jgi:predicted NUDIX family NTP pyrophosphohydrolase
MFRVRDGALEVLLVHLGGPYWAKKDVWFLPKGEIEPDEDELAAAQREFGEETGLRARAPFLPLGSVAHKGGKRVVAWAFEGDCDPARIESNSFTLEWPPKSGRFPSFPEVDRAAFFTLETARSKAHPAELELIERLDAIVRQRGVRSPPR